MDSQTTPQEPDLDGDGRRRRDFVRGGFSLGGAIALASTASAAPKDTHWATPARKGGKLLVPITGGVPPFKAMLAGPLAKGSVSATAEAADDGGYRFRLEASEDVPPGTYAVIASDAAGVTRPFQVRIEPKAGGK